MYKKLWNYLQQAKLLALISAVISVFGKIRFFLTKPLNHTTREVIVRMVFNTQRVNSPCNVWFLFWHIFGIGINILLNRLKHV